MGVLGKPELPRHGEKGRSWSRRGRWPALSHGRLMTSCHPILWEEAANAELSPQQQLFSCPPGEMMITWDVRFWSGPSALHTLLRLSRGTSWAEWAAIF